MDLYLEVSRIFIYFRHCEILPASYFFFNWTFLLCYSEWWYLCIECYLHKKPQSNRLEITGHLRTICWPVLYQQTSGKPWSSIQPIDLQCKAKLNTIRFNVNISLDSKYWSLANLMLLKKWCSDLRNNRLATIVGELSPPENVILRYYFTTIMQSFRIVSINWILIILAVLV